MTTAELELPMTSAATPSTSTTMKALVYHGPAQRAWEDKPRLTIEDPGDGIVRIGLATSERKLKNLDDKPLGSVDVSELSAAHAHEIFQSRGGEHAHGLETSVELTEFERHGSGVEAPSLYRRGKQSDYEFHAR